ncbi:MAG: sigma-70 family RNA polymerase sigma factor [Chloroflexi bacterium]|nr:sigma-70 family RNA polymerase sigma factor [Chloroflexota bacterium]
MVEDLQQSRVLPDAEAAALVERAVGGDRESFGRLYDAYVDRIYRHIYYRVGNPTEAEDLTAQVFLNAWKAIGRYRQMGRPFVVWLLSIANNQVIDFYRAQKDRTYLDDPGVTISDGIDPEEIAERDYTTQELQEAIQKLKPDQRRVLVLRFIDGLDYADIAAIMQKKEGAVRVIQHRALLALRKLLRTEVGGP